MPKLVSTWIQEELLLRPHLIWPRTVSLFRLSELWLEGGLMGFQKNLVSRGISGSDSVKNLCFKGPVKKHLNCLVQDERPGLLKTRVAPPSTAGVSRRQFRESNVSKNLCKKQLLGAAGSSTCCSQFSELKTHGLHPGHLIASLAPGLADHTPRR